MVYLAPIPRGLREILDALEAAKTPVWCTLMRCPKQNLRTMLKA